MKLNLSLLCVAGACLASAQTSLFHVVPTPNFFPSGNDALNAVSASSAGDIWAVGQSTIHFDGTVWTAVSAPHLTGLNENALLGVADLSPTNAWAVGYTITPSQTQLLEHWDGTEWSDFPGPRLPKGSEAYLSSISADSPTDIWAAGHILQDDMQQLFGLIEHYDGTTWTFTEIPFTPFLNAIAAISPDDVWVAGYSGETGEDSKTFLSHWNGTEWTQVPSPNVGSGANAINGLVAVATNNVWAVGYSTAKPDQDPTFNLIEHWNGTEWSVVTSPNVGPTTGYQSNRLFGITAVSATDLWAFGSSFAPNGSGQQLSLAMQGNGTTWTIMPTPSPDANGFRSDVLFGGAVAGPGNLYIVGSQDEAPSPITGTLVLHTTGG
jgi:hypothetical protein